MQIKYNRIKYSKIQSSNYLFLNINYNIIASNCNNYILIKTLNYNIKYYYILIKYVYLSDLKKDFLYNFYAILPSVI